MIRLENRQSGRSEDSRRRHLLMAGLLVLVLGCGGETPGERDPPPASIPEPFLQEREGESISVAAPALYVAGPGDTIDGVVERFNVVRDGIPAHPDTDAFVRMLVKVAQRELDVAEDTARELLVHRFADEPLGVYLFLTQDTPQRSLGMAGALAYAEKTLGQLAGTSVGRAALDRVLAHLLAQSPEAFLRRCAVVIDGAPDSKGAPLALLRRFEYHREHDRRAAGLDALLFLSRYEEKAVAWGEDYALTAALGHSGWVLEEKLLAGLVEGRQDTARRLYESLARAGGDAGSDSEPIASFDRCYFEHAPVLAAILEQSPNAGRGHDATPLTPARLGALAARAFELDEAVQYYIQFADQARRLLEAPSQPPPNWPLLQAVCQVAVEQLEQVQGMQDYFPDRAKNVPIVTALTVGTLSGRLLALQIELLEAAYGSGEPVAEETVYNQVVRNANLLLAQRDYRIAQDLYEAFIAKHPDGPFTPDILLQLGAFHMSLDDPFRAVEVYQDLVNEHADTVQGMHGQLELGIAYHACRMFEEGRFVLEGLLGRPIPPAVASKAHYYLGLCLHALGEADGALRHMRRAFEDHLRTESAPLALFWYAHEKHITSEFREAHEYYEYFLDAYHGHPLAQQVRTLAEGLERHFARENGAEPLEVSSRATNNHVP